MYKISIHFKIIFQKKKLPNEAFEHLSVLEILLHTWIPSQTDGSMLEQDFQRALA